MAPATSFTASKASFASGVTAEEPGSIVGGKLCAGEAGGASHLTPELSRATKWRPLE